MLKTRRPLRQFLFHPLTILVVSISAASLFMLLMMPLPRFSGQGRFFLLYYHAPIGVAFVAYLFDRAEHVREIPFQQIIVEIVVLTLALSRVMIKTPYFSGHSLFLSYMILTVSSRVAWWTAMLVLLDVVYIKVFILQDATFWGGIIIGISAAIFTRIGKSWSSIG